MTTMFRTGDRILHKPTGHTLVLAYADYISGKFAATGSNIGEGYIHDCSLVSHCSDDEFVGLIAELAVSGDPRAERAAQIAATLIGEQA